MNNRYFFLFLSFFCITILFTYTKAEKKEAMFFSAIKTGDLSFVKKMISARKIKNINMLDSIEWTPLHVAVLFRKKEIVTFLIENGATINKKTLQDTPLFWAVLMNDIEIAELLLQNQANVHIKSSAGSMLALAIKQGCAAMVDLLIQHHAMVTHKDIFLAEKQENENAAIIIASLQSAVARNNNQ